MKESPAKIKRRQKEQRIRIAYGCLLAMAFMAMSAGVIKATAEPQKEMFMLSAAQEKSEIKKIAIVEPLIIREVQTEIELETMPFRIEKRINNSLDEGIENVLREGREGTCANVFSVFIENGIETARVLAKETVVREPVSRIVEIGTIPNFINSRGDRVRYNDVLEMRATSYTASYKDTGKNPEHPQFGITYTGMTAKLGVIAVDPRVIPLGTKVYVEGVGSVPDYGYAIAADIGSAIKGDLIDLYFNDQKTVDAWGCKNVRVYILRDQKVDIFALRANQD